jgi:hypothetical protein
VGLTLLTERYAHQIAGVLGCWDRVLIFGTLPKICYAEGMTSYLYERKVRIFDYPKFAEPFRNELRENAERLAADSGIEIEFLRKRNVRKEDRVKEILAQRGDHPGLVCILSAMEPCSTYKPWHNKSTGKTYLLPDDGKCLHYYFYWLDEEVGLCYVRVPTWLPCRLQIYFNGHSWLASVLRKRKIDFTLLDNAFRSVLGCTFLPRKTVIKVVLFETIRRFRDTIRLKTNVRSMRARDVRCALTVEVDAYRRAFAIFL